jgi:hypothetical protein
MVSARARSLPSELAEFAELLAWFVVGAEGGVEAAEVVAMGV